MMYIGTLKCAVPANSNCGSPEETSTPQHPGSFYIASSFFSLPCLFASNNLDLVKYDRKHKHNNRATQISCCPEAALTHAFNMIEPSQTHRFVYRA